MISTVCRDCPVNTWCEYDPLTDTVYPGEESECLLREEQNQ